MPKIRLAEGLSVHCAVDDYLWPWEAPTPVLMMHGFARNASFWNAWVPTIAESRRIYRPDLLGCGRSDVPAEGYRFTPEKIEAEILAVFDAFALPRVHWVGESSGGLIGLLLAAAHPERIASLVLCNTPTRISDDIRRIYALDQESTAAAMRRHPVGSCPSRQCTIRAAPQRRAPDRAGSRAYGGTTRQRYRRASLPPCSPGRASKFL